MILVFYVLGPFLLILGLSDRHLLQSQQLRGHLHESLPRRKRSKRTFSIGLHLVYSFKGHLIYLDLILDDINDINNIF